jgi:hypothetical protein
MGTPTGAGIDAYKNYLQDTAQRLDDEKHQDLWSTVAQIGFGMAASSSPYALQAAGQAAAAAMPAMEKAMQARREEAKESLKDQAAMDLQNFGFKQSAVTAGTNLYKTQLDSYDKSSEIFGRHQDVQTQVAGEIKAAQVRAAAEVAAIQSAPSAQTYRALVGAGYSPVDALASVNGAAQGENPRMTAYKLIDNQYRLAHQTEYLANANNPQGIASLEANRDAYMQSELPKVAAMFQIHSGANPSTADPLGIRR